MGQADMVLALVVADEMTVSVAIYAVDS